MARTKKDRGELRMLRGTLFTLRRKCGKATCRCTGGAPHESPALAYPEAGRTRTVTLRADDVDEVQRALDAYATAKAELDRVADAGLAALVSRLAARRGR